MCPGLHCAPGGARKPHGLQGNGLPHQRARWFAMTGLGVQWGWRQRGGSGKLTAGARPRRAAANLPGTLAPTDQAPKTVIARSAATWQSVLPQCGSIAPAVRPVMPPGRYSAPAGARKPCGLRGNGLPRPLRGLAMTGLEVRCVWTKCRGFRGRAAGDSQPPYGMDFGRAFVSTHPPRS